MKNKRDQQLASQAINENKGKNTSVNIFTGCESQNAYYLLTPTRVEGVTQSSVFVRQCVCLSVCMSLFVRITEPKRLKLQSPNLPQGQSVMSPGYSFNIRSKGQRSRSQGQKVQNISGDRVAGVSLHFIEWPTSISSDCSRVLQPQQDRLVSGLRVRYWSVLSGHIVLLMLSEACRLL